jgi:hypothetical protein
MASLNFSLGNKRTGFDKKFTSAVTAAIDDALLDLAIELQRTSPVATGELRDSWDVVPASTGAGSSVVVGRVVVNKADNALFRVRGRAKGRQPPVSAIAAWLSVIGGDPKLAFVIARSIGKKGTKRHRDQKNNAGIDNAGNPKPDSPITKASKALERKLKSIKI